MSSVEYYSRDRRGNQFYRHLKNGTEIYAKVKAAKDVFAQKVNGDPFYAKHNNGDEMYPLFNKNYINIIGKEGDVYAKKKSGAEIYPKEIIGPQKTKDRVLKDKHGHPKYAKDNHGNELYPKDVEGHEFMEPDGHHALDFDGRPIYRLDASGKPMYPKGINGGETYIHKDPRTQKLFVALDKSGYPVYAKDRDLNEYYPEADVVGQDILFNPVYAVSRTQTIIYPKKPNGNEYYVKSNAQDMYALLESTIQKGGRYDYAKLSSGKEVYPNRKIGQSNVDMYLNNRYARDEQGNPYYPKDDCGNEFYIDFSLNIPEQERFPNGYPLSRDSFYIVPKREDNAYLLPQSNLVPDIQIKDIVEELYRIISDDYDFLTSVKSSRSELDAKAYKPSKKRKVDPTLITQFEPTELSFNTHYYLWGILGLLVLFIFVKFLI